MQEPDSYHVQRLAWDDPALGTIEMPTRPLEIVAGFGSGLARRVGDAEGLIWAVGDRGPNLKAKLARRRYGVEGLEDIEAIDGARIMPRVDLGPTIAQLRVFDDRVELVRTMAVRAMDGRTFSGLPLPGSDSARHEPAFDLDGQPLGRDPCGADTEGIAAFADGSFWIGEEYGPSLLKVDPEGRVVRRLVPQGLEESVLDAGSPIEGCLPPIAGLRQLNRGFEALALSDDEAWLFLAFQSPLAHPDEETHANARHVRIWKLDAAGGAVVAQYLYPLDPPESFRRDWVKGEFGPGDIKIGELTTAGSDLLVLERGSETSKIYRVRIGEGAPTPAEHLHIATRPSIEELSAAGSVDLPVLAKELLFSSDDAGEVAADLEGMVLLSPTELLLASDNDFGVEGAQTSFWRVRFERPLFGG